MTLTRACQTWVVLGFVLVGCGAEPVTVELVFPSISHLVVSDQAEVVAFARSGETNCPALTVQALASVEPAAGRRASTSSHGVCSFLDGGRALDGLEEDTYDILAVTRQQAGIPLFAGCVPVELSLARQTVSITLGALSDAGRDELATAAECDSIEERCQGKCR